MILLTVTEFRNNLSKYLELAFKEKIALKSKNGIIELNPSKEIFINPSPSNDPWFESKENMSELNKRLANIDKGTTKQIPMQEAKDLFEI